MSTKRSILRSIARADGLNEHEVKEVTTYGRFVVEESKMERPYKPVKNPFKRPKGFHTKLVKGKVVKCKE